MSEDKQALWLGEFNKLGVEKVRNGLMLNRWQKEQSTAARQWLEQRDAAKFRAAHTSDSEPRKKMNAKMLGYLAAGILLLVVIGRVLPRLL